MKLSWKNWRVVTVYHGTGNTVAALVHPTPPQKGREQLESLINPSALLLVDIFKAIGPDFIRFKQCKFPTALQYRPQLIRNNFQSLFMCSTSTARAQRGAHTDPSSAQTSLNGLGTYMSVFQLLFLQLKYPQLAAFWTDMSGFFRSHNMATT